MSDEPSKLEEAFGKALASQVVTGQGTAMLVEIIARQLEEIKRAVTPTIEDEPRYVTLPDQGGFFALPIGTTSINFHEGTVTLPDGTKVNLRLRLKQFGVEKMKSVMFITAQPITFSFDGAGQFDLQAGEKIALGDFPFKEIYLETSVVGAIRLMAAVTPQFTVFHDRYFSNDFKDAFGPLSQTLYAADETVQQELDMDLGATTGRYIVEAAGHADVATTFTLDTSVDGVHWFNTYTSAAPETDYHAGYGNAMEFIRLRSAAAGAPGNKVNLALTATR